MLKKWWERLGEKMGKVFKKKTGDKWAENQIKEMAKLRSKLILM